MLMKKILFLFLVIALASCNSVGNAPTVIDEKFDPTLDSLYIQCKDLKGIGKLRIGKVTYRQVKKDKGITLSPILFDTYTNFYNGYWGESSSMEVANYIEDNATKIKQFHVGKYKVGELTIDDVDLAFYRDTLVAISFDCSYKLLEHYKSKYGNGKGSNYRYTYSRGEYGEKGYVFECKEKEDRMWANERVTMKYEHYWDQRTATGERQRVYGSTSCVISSNDRYDDFLNELDKHKKVYKELKEAKTQASYDSL